MDQDANPWADTSPESSFHNTDDRELDQSLQSIPPPEPSEPPEYNQLPAAERKLLKEAEEQVLRIHVAGELVGALSGAIGCVLMRKRFNIGPFVRRDMSFVPGKPKPPFVKYYSTDYPAMTAAGLVGGRLGQERAGWARGNEVMALHPENTERIRRSFGCDNNKDTVRAYRMLKYQAQGLPAPVARAMYHLAYLSP